MSNHESSTEIPGNYVPEPGEHVFCYRHTDGESLCGVAEESNVRLSLKLCGHENWWAALDSPLWRITPIDPTPSCHRITR